jgi:hypothetical protein
MGFLQARLQDRHGPIKAVVLTALFFTFQHIYLIIASGAAAVIFPFFLVTALGFRALVDWTYNGTDSLFIVGLACGEQRCDGRQRAFWLRGDRHAVRESGLRCRVAPRHCIDCRLGTHRRDARSLGQRAAEGLRCAGASALITMNELTVEREVTPEQLPLGRVSGGWYRRMPAAPGEWDLSKVPDPRRGHPVDASYVVR